MAPSRWQQEPFRAFFPLGVLLAWVGVGHWLLYTLGVTSTYSCLGHGFVQIEGFLMAFAAGFLMTAIPRRTQAPPPARATLWLVGSALVAAAVAAIDERWAAGQVAYLVALATLLGFAVRRFVGGTAGRRPPPSFVLVPLGVAAGGCGAGLVLAWAAFGAPVWTLGLGRLLVEQGLFLCLIVGVGGLLLPLMGGAPPPGDLGGTPGAGRAAAGYAMVGLAILGSLVAEQLGSVRAAPLVRAAVVVVGLLAAGAASPPRQPGLNRRLAWTAAWLVPAGLVGSGLWPDFRVAALHVTFIGGFALLAFAVATHVTLGHLGLEAVRDGRPPAVVAVAAAFVLAMLARVAADASGAYFVHLGWAAGIWLVGSAAWLGFLGPKLLRR
ncbi:MAG TPA: NnrS family protein [Candidatus Binatia bacterium]|nr:NnrS family protein [Candidatus Binatia bacterium]